MAIFEVIRNVSNNKQFWQLSARVIYLKILISIYGVTKYIIIQIRQSLNIYMNENTMYSQCM